MARGDDRRKPIHIWFVYASLVFLVVFLVRRGLLQWPAVHSVSALLASLPLLVLGFYASAGSWRRMLALSALPTRASESLASMGLSIFGKYLPGKIWTLLGRAAYLAERRGYRLSTLSALSINEQILSWWVGLMFGVAGLFLIGSVQAYAWSALTAWVLLSGVIFTPWLHRIAEVLLRRVLGRDLVIPSVGVRTVVQILPWALTVWAAWGGGFYLLVVALSPVAPSATAGLAFPLGATLGAMALLAPGGLGVREGVVAAYLLGTGVPAEVAVSVSAASRLWFLLGEVVFFVTGVIATRRAA